MWTHPQPKQLEQAPQAALAVAGDGAGVSQQCTALVPFPADGAGTSRQYDALLEEGGQQCTALVVRPPDAAGSAQQDHAVVPLPMPQPHPTENADAHCIRRSGRLERKRGKPDTPDGYSDMTSALVPLPEDAAGAEQSQLEGPGDPDHAGSAGEHEDEDECADQADAPDSGKGKGKKGRKKGSASQKRSKLDPSLEAEFALAMLENNSLREIVDLLKISRAELPAMSAEEARSLLATSSDPLAEAHAKRAQELQKIAEAAQEQRADDATLLRVARFLEVQNGTDLELVSQPLARLITEDMQARARELEQQNAETCDIQLRGKKRKANSIHLNCTIHPSLLWGREFASFVVVTGSLRMNQYL